MATDAEVKLNFKAETEEVKTQLAALKALIDGMAEALKGLGVDGATPIPEETLAIMRELTSEVERLRAEYSSLQTQFVNLQEVNSDLSHSFREQLHDLRLALDDTIERAQKLTRTVEGQTEQIKRLREEIEELKKKHKESTDAGIHGYRSLRSAVGNFIISLLNGKFAIQELGAALKGLTYSTIVLGAIQAAMDGITAAWEALKSSLGYGSQELEAAARHMEEASSAAKSAAVEANEAGRKITDAEKATALRTELEEISSYYQQIKDNAEKTVTAIQKQAQAEVRRRALQRESEGVEFQVEEIELRDKYARGEVSEREYKKAQISLQLRREEAENNRALEDAKASVKTHEDELQAVSDIIAEQETRLKQLEDALKGLQSPDTINNIKAQYKKLTTDAAKQREELNNMQVNAGFWDLWIAGLSPWTNKSFWDKINGQELKANNATNRAQKYFEENPIKNTPEEYTKTKKSVDELTQSLDELKKKYEDLKEREKDSREELRLTNNETLTRNKNAKRIAEAQITSVDVAQDAKERKRREKEDADTRKKRDRLQGNVDKLVRNATKAIAETPTDFKDDRRAFDAIGKFLEDNADAVKQYGVNVSSLLDVTRKLVLAFNGAEQQRARMAAEIAALKSSVDQLNKYRNKQ